MPNCTHNVFLSGWIPTLNYTWTKMNVQWLCHEKIAMSNPSISLAYFSKCLVILELMRRTTFVLGAVLLERTGAWPGHVDAGKADFTPSRDQCKIHNITSQNTSGLFSVCVSVHQLRPRGECPAEQHNQSTEAGWSLPSLSAHCLIIFKPAPAFPGFGSMDSCCTCWWALLVQGKFGSEPPEEFL